MRTVGAKMSASTRRNYCWLSINSMIAFVRIVWESMKREIDEQ
jgi:hypothetical protein